MKRRKMKPGVIIKGKPTAEVCSCGAARITTTMARLTTSMAATAGSATSKPPMNIWLPQLARYRAPWALKPCSLIGRMRKLSTTS